MAGPNETPPRSALKRHKTELMLGAGGIVVTVALYLRSKGTSATTAPTYSAPAPSSVTYLPETTGSADVGSPSIGSGSFGTGATAPGARAPTAGVAPPGAAPAPSSPGKGQTPETTPAPRPSALTPTESVTQQALPAGAAGYSATAHYGSGIVTGSTGGAFSTISSKTATLQMIQSGESVDYEPAEGVFVPITSVAQLNQIETSSAKPWSTTTWAKS